MNKLPIGIALLAQTPSQTVDMIVRAEAAGVDRYWLTTGIAAPDALTTFAAAARVTKSIRLGTAVVPTFPRHPLAMAQQAQVIGDLAPGRFVLGVGPSHQPIIENTFGLSFDRPLQHLREYVTILKTALHNGRVDFDGHRLHAHTTLSNPTDIPVMISALRPNAFRLAGEVADGAITWMCPAPYLRSVALPALGEGAAHANRPRPPLVAGLFLAVASDLPGITRFMCEKMSAYLKMPFYQQMLVDAGFQEARSGVWGETLVNACVIHGQVAAVADQVRAFLETSEADEVLLSVVPLESSSYYHENAIRVIASL